MKSEIICVVFSLALTGLNAGKSFVKPYTLRCFYYLMIARLNVISIDILTSIVGKCPDTFVEHDKKCYKVSIDRLSWHEARFECLSLNGNYDLAIIDNLELFEFMKKYTNHWIGLYSRVGKRDFKWVDGTVVEFGKTGKQKPWGSLEPSVRFINTDITISFYHTLNIFVQARCLSSAYLNDIENITNGNFKLF